LQDVVRQVIVEFDETREHGPLRVHRMDASEPGRGWCRRGLRRDDHTVSNVEAPIVDHAIARIHRDDAPREHECPGYGRIDWCSHRVPREPGRYGAIRTSMVWGDRSRGPSRR